MSSQRCGFFGIFFCFLLLNSQWAVIASEDDPNFLNLASLQTEQALMDRRHIHENAELSLREFKTQEYLKRSLAGIPGIKEIEGEWGTGIVALLEGEMPGPVVAWRTDMDALPITETTGLPFACERIDTLSGGRVTGVMHACGHDMHMAISLGMLRTLSSLRDRLPGSVLFIGEPGEEIGAGARSLIDAGIFAPERMPRCALALHVHPTLPYGTLGSCPGWATGNVDGFRLKVFGDGGHGAYPHRGVDPIPIAARMILAFQSIVSREIDVNHHAVISVGRISGGTTSNVIPSEVALDATVRTHDDETRQRLKELITRTVTGIAAAAGAPEPELEYYFGTAAGYNHPELVQQVRSVFRELLGPEADLEYPAGMGGEDFGYFGRIVPGFQFRIGVARPDQEPQSLHTPVFDPDERALTLGIAVSSAVIWDQLHQTEALTDPSELIE